MKRLLVAMAMLCVSLAAVGQNAAVNGFCTAGGKPAKTQGAFATNFQQEIIPSCTVTVYLTGTLTLATLVTSTGSAAPNPFTANAVGSAAPGQWLFYTLTGTGVDIVLSGGIAPNTFPTPVTITDVVAGGSGGSGAFNPLVKDAISGPTGGTTEVVGLLSNLLPTLTPGFLNWTGSAWAFSPGGGGGAAPNPPIFSLQAYATGSSLTSDPNITINTATHTLTSTNFTTPTRSYQNRGDMIDAVADCGEVGDGVRDNSAARSACLAAHPFVTEFFPPRYFNGTSDVQAVYVTNSTTSVPSKSVLASTAGTYLASQGAILKCPAGVTCIQMGQSAGLANINVQGSEIASIGSSDGQNAIFPSGATLTEYQQPIQSIQITSNVLTVNFLQRTYWLPGGIVQLSGIPSPNAGLNGYYYVISTMENITVGHPASITVAVPGASNISLTTLSGTCPSGACVIPPTTGTSTSVGVQIIGSFASMNGVSVGDFGRAGVEVNGTGNIADDPILNSVTSYNNRGHGLFVHGGDANVGQYSNYDGYFNGIYCVFDIAFLSSAYYNPQCSYNDGYGAFAAGLPVTISSIARTVTSNIATVAVTTSAPLASISVGNAVYVTGVTDSSFNTATTSTASGWVTSVTDNSHFSYIQPGYNLSNSTSSGGLVQLPNRLQTYTAAGFDGGSYTIGRNVGTNRTIFAPGYNEGDGAVAQPDGCANKFNLGVESHNALLGNCTDSNWPASTSSSAGVQLQQFSPHSVNIFNSPKVSFFSGGGTDTTNSVFGTQDFLTAGSLPTSGLDWRFTNPGQNNSYFGARAQFALDEAGMYNYAMLIGYSASASAGESGTVGSVTFNGSGLNDMTAAGTPTQSFASTYVVAICGTGTPDQLCWGPSSTGAVQTAVLGSSAGTGYSVGDIIEITGGTSGDDAFFYVASVGGGGALTGITTYPRHAGLGFSIGPNQATLGLQGPITASHVGVIGTGYSASETCLVNPGNGIQAALTITSVNGSGGVTGFTITNPGTLYTVRNKAMQSCSGAGTSFQVSIDQVSGTGATLSVTAVAGMSAPINITGSAQTLQNGITATFAATTGHTLTDNWTFPITVTLGGRPSVWFPEGIALGNTTFNSGKRKIEMCSATPTSTQSPDGQWFVGDVCINSGASNTTIFAWQCVVATAGPPSTCTSWATVGNSTGGGSSVTWPTSGDVVVSNSTNSPAGIAEVDGECVVGAAGAWGAGACSGSAATAFSAITGSTNTTAAMVVGTGASIAATGSGAITATAVPAAGITGTTLPSGIVTSSLTALGTIATGVWQGTLIGSTHGGTGVNNASTLTLGSSNQNWATLGTGVVKNTTTTGALSNAIAADIIALWTGTCNSSSFLRGDGACAATPTGTVTSIVFSAPLTGGTVTTTGTVGCPTCVTSAASLTNLHLMLGAGSQASQVDTATSDGSGNIAVASVTANGGGIPISSGTNSNTDLTGRVTLSGGTFVYTLTATYTHPPNWIVQDVTTPANVCSAVETTTTVTFTGTGTDICKYIAIGTN